MRRKEYAVSIGLATPGKGRMSQAALEAIAAERARGTVFDDDDVTPRAPKAPAIPREAPVRPVKGAVAHVRSEGVMENLRYPLGQMFKGVDSNGKTHTVNAAQACSCGYSLLGHVCNNPTALVSWPLERIAVTPV